MDTKHVDLNYLKEISGEKKDLINEMIEIFNSEVPGYVKLLHEYYKNRNWEALEKLSHKAKASASIMGMKQLTGELKELELLAKEKKDNKHIPALLQSIESEFLAAIKELKSFTKTL